MSQRFHQIYQQLITRPQAALCQFEDAQGKRCNSTAIFSHTIQKSRTLAAISQDGHVLQLKQNVFRSAAEERVAFEKIGIQKASIFPGFCPAHDDALFKSVETGNGSISDQERILLSFRSVCHELFKKEQVISAYSDQNLRRAAAENGLTGLIDAHLLGCKLARRDLLRNRASHLNYMHNGVGKFTSVVFRTDAELPFAFSTAFSPEYDVFGNEMLPPEKEQWGSVSCISGNIKGGSVLLFAGFDDVERHPVSKFLFSLSSLPPKRIGGFALHTGIEFAENFFFRPSWINSLLPELRAEIVRRFRSGVPGRKSKIKKELVQQFDIVRIGGELLLG